MIMRQQLLISVTVLVLMTGYAAAAPSEPPCKGNPRIVDACFNIRGRLGLYNGTPVRIWVVGTHHMLSVFDIPSNSGEELPTSIMELLGNAPFDTAVFGNYEVCPLDKFHAGWMQTVCIERATNLIARPWADTQAK